MKRLLCPEIPKPGKPAVLPAQEADHATRVLRLREGDIVQAMDGKGGSVLARLRVKGGSPRLEVDEEAAAGVAPFAPPTAEGVLPVVLEMSVLKGDAMEWVVEKSVELGIRTLVPVLTAHCVVQMKNKGPEAFRERWQKIADQALKQCGRLERLEIAMPIALEERITQKSARPALRFWCDEAAPGEAPLLMKALQDSGSVLQQHDTTILIGPEGGWSFSEREMLLRMESPALRRVSLGPRILRAETAAIYAMSLVSGVLQLNH